jgi:hypothetical protein
MAYALCVRSLILILAIIALAAPLRWVEVAACGASEWCGIATRGVGRNADTPPLDIAVDCCGREFVSIEADASDQQPEAPDDRPRHAPSDNCDCPLRCCAGTVKVPVHHPASVEIETDDSLETVAASGAQAEPTPPNLRRLKRPPRFSAVN